MQFTRFGQTGLTVSRMILGTRTFGKQTDEKEAHRMLDKAAEAGINFIDTPDVHPPGAEVGGAEIIAGRWLHNKRAGFILGTKGGGKMGPSAWDAGGSRKHLLTPSTLPCAASIRITLTYIRCTSMILRHRLMKPLKPWTQL